VFLDEPLSKLITAFAQHHKIPVKKVSAIRTLVKVCSFIVLILVAVHWYIRAAVTACMIARAELVVLVVIAVAAARLCVIACLKRTHNVSA
jgi:hypothetical protein